jgi:hypothetical protein
MDLIELWVIAASFIVFYPLGSFLAIYCDSKIDSENKQEEYNKLILRAIHGGITLIGFMLTVTAVSFLN